MRQFVFLILFAIAGQGFAAQRNVGSATNQQVFNVTGLVVEVTPEEKSIRIKHDEIPGYMPPMTMSFDVKDTNELAGVEAGHPVSFRMIVTENYGWIDQVKVTGPKRNDPPTTGPFRLVRDVEPLEVGDRLPPYSFTNQAGKVFSTDDFKGKVWAINFLFTRCPFPTFCPQTARYFGETQAKLLASEFAPTNWHLLSLSFDPEFDTPQVLSRFAEYYEAKPAQWTFATGALIDVTAICDQLGLKFSRDERGGFDHNLRTVVIDADGRVKKIFIGNEWNPEVLAAEMTAALRAHQAPRQAR
ncbi:MAG TPA: SCO family protein [Verrucomicrobiae bacterium]|nr:SCO family protein [Verrucomicrobiae bacterium]